jgi:hypothetical protein
MHPARSCSGRRIPTSAETKSTVIMYSDNSLHIEQLSRVFKLAVDRVESLPELPTTADPQSIREALDKLPQYLPPKGSGLKRQRSFLAFFFSEVDR